MTKLQYLKGSKEQAVEFGVEFDTRLWNVLDPNSPRYKSTVSLSTLKELGILS